LSHKTRAWLTKKKVKRGEIKQLHYHTGYGENPKNGRKKWLHPGEREKQILQTTRISEKGQA